MSFSLSFQNSQRGGSEGLVETCSVAYAESGMIMKLSNANKLRDTTRDS